MIIHIIGTMTGQVNEGMRNIATHLAKEFETDNKVLYSGLKQIPQILINSKKSDVTLIFARANKNVYELAKIVSMLCPNTWIVLVQKPDADFINKNNSKPLKCNYLSITENDIEDVKIVDKYKKELFNVGIKSNKFLPVSSKRQEELKIKYGFDPRKLLVVHVGHCSKGRGLEDFLQITTAQRMIVASGMFEDQQVVGLLNKSGVSLHTGYLENVEEIYQMADVYLFPTKSTEFVISIPLSVMEALSAGVPVIGYKSFKNLTEISSKDGAIVLIEEANDIDEVLPMIAKMKSEVSLLNNTDSWKVVASKVLNVIKEN